MNLFTAAVIFVVPLTAPPVQAHEKELQPRVERVATEAPKSVWRVEPSGAATHLQSTLVCPASLATFERSALIPFDGFGLDVGCNFDSPTAGRVTIYLTRAGQSAQEYFDESKAALTTYNPDAKLIDGPAPLPSGTTKFLGALYNAGGGTRTALWVADLSGWKLKFRATYPEGKQSEVLDAIANLADQAQSSGGTHLAACAAAPAVERNGTRIEEKELITRLSLIGGMSDQAGSESLAPPKINERWCAEDTVQSREAPLLYWRNVANTGKDGPLDRLSLMTMDEPEIWLIGGNEAANMLVDKPGANAPTIHQLTESDGDAIYFFAYYRGRPNLNTLIPLAHDIVLGKAKPVAKAKRTNGTVTLPKNAPPGT